jgi:hypothetical protein
MEEGNPVRHWRRQNWDRNLDARGQNGCLVAPTGIIRYIKKMLILKRLQAEDGFNEKDSLPRDTKPSTPKIPQFDAKSQKENPINILQPARVPFP